MVPMWCQRKCSATSTSPPAHLLSTQALHQRFHHYFSRHECIMGNGKNIYNLPSRYTHPTDTQILHHFNTHFLQPLPWSMWT